MSTSELQLDIEFEEELISALDRQFDESLTINKASTQDLSEVENRLAALASIKNDIPLIIDPDDSVPIGRVIDVYDMSRRLNFQQIQFAVEPG